MRDRQRGTNRTSSDLIGAWRQAPSQYCPPGLPRFSASPQRSESSTEAIPGAGPSVSRSARTARRWPSSTTSPELFDTSTFEPRVTVSNGALRSPVFSPDGSLIALPSAGKDLTRVTNRGSVDLRDTSTGRLLRTLPAAPLSGDRVAALDQITFSSDGRSLYGLLVVARLSAAYEACCKVDYIVRWDVATGQQLGIPTRANDGDAVGFALTATGTLVVSGDYSTIWDAHSMKLLATIPAGGASTMGASPDGATMALGEADGSVRFVDLQTRRERTGAGGHTAAVQSIGFTPDSKTAISTGDDRHVLILGCRHGNSDPRPGRARRQCGGVGERRSHALHSELGRHHLRMGPIGEPSLRAGVHRRLGQRASEPGSVTGSTFRLTGRPLQ